MRIFGIDFTSAPRKAKPIICIEARLQDHVLTTTQCHPLTSFNDFEAFLDTAGPWVAAFDFPFSLPRHFIETINWPTHWSDFIERVAACSPQEFELTISRYRDAQPVGKKHPLRVTDALAHACSPLMLFGVPVGRMFFTGAPRLYRSGISILPVCATADSRIAMEGYPALLARRILGKKPNYKSDTRQKQTQTQQDRRKQFMNTLLSTDALAPYQLTLQLDDSVCSDSFSGDPSGDKIDALLCAIQAAWAYQQTSPAFGIPSHCDALEGWIIDPEMLSLPDTAT